MYSPLFKFLIFCMFYYKSVNCTNENHLCEYLKNPSTFQQHLEPLSHHNVIIPPLLIASSFYKLSSPSTTKSTTKSTSTLTHGCIESCCRVESCMSVVIHAKQCFHLNCSFSSNLLDDNLSKQDKHSSIKVTSDNNVKDTSSKINKKLMKRSVLYNKTNTHTDSKTNNEKITHTNSNTNNINKGNKELDKSKHTNVKNIDKDISKEPNILLKSVGTKDETKNTKGVTKNIKTNNKTQVASCPHNIHTSQVSPSSPSLSTSSSSPSSSSSSSSWLWINVRENTRFIPSNKPAVTTNTSINKSNKPNQKEIVKASKTTTTNTDVTPPTLTIPHTTPLMTTTTLMWWTVSAGGNQTIRLPDNNITLYATVLPTPLPSEELLFRWSMTASSQPRNQVGQMSGVTTPSLKLTSLGVGSYTFKVGVKGRGSSKEASTHVIVKPAAHKNTPPKVVVVPKNQKLNQNNVLIIDGSSSTDDSDSIKFKWDLISGPVSSLGNALFNTSILKLPNGLTPGLYKFKLTVTDSQGLSNSKNANVQVIKEVDYPPKANAGSNLVVVQLPTNKVVLLGNKSSDDRKIVSYQWTKLSDQLACDMVNVRTAFLQLSNLQEGDYVFKLVVKDVANQSDEAIVHVIVKPAKNQRPKADAGQNATFWLPLQTIPLDASNSSDDTAIAFYHWKLMKGPKGTTIKDPKKKVTNVEGVKMGVVVVELRVVDAAGLEDRTQVVYTVKQNPNTPPVAVAGNDVSIDLDSQNWVKLNGSASHDDKAIVSYKWKRLDSSPAVGEVILEGGGVLWVVNVGEGVYKFELVVVDEEGLSGKDEVMLTVNPGVRRDSLVQVMLAAQPKHFTVVEKEALLKHLESLMHDVLVEKEVGGVEKGVVVACRVVLHRLLPDSAANKILVEFFVELLNSTTTSPPPSSTKKPTTLTPIHPHPLPFSSTPEEGWWMVRSDVVMGVMLGRYSEGGYLLEYSILLLQPVVCHSTCSDHGTCDQVSKVCACHYFWLSNWFRRYYGDHQTNCDWSVIYVVIIISIIIITTFTTCWCVVRAVVRKIKKSAYRPIKSHKRKHRYYLLDKEKDFGLEEEEDEEDDGGGGGNDEGDGYENGPQSLNRLALSSSEETLFIKTPNNNNKSNYNNITKVKQDNSLLITKSHRNGPDTKMTSVRFKGISDKKKKKKKKEEEEEEEDGGKGDIKLNELVDLDDDDGIDDVVDDDDDDDDVEEIRVDSNKENTCLISNNLSNNIDYNNNNNINSGNRINPCVNIKEEGLGRGLMSLGSQPRNGMVLRGMKGT